MYSKIFNISLTAAFLLAVVLVEGKLVRHTFSVGYITGSPDGVRVNHILGINGKFPGPLIEAEVGDTLEVTLVNNIQDGQNVSMHWHGLVQRGTPFEDGPAGITQCPLKNGMTQRYRIPLTQAGTYWYHSHVNSQYCEGLWGTIIIRAKQEVWKDHYDQEILITLNDWYHNSGLENEEFLLSPESQGAPPYPASALINGMGRYPCIYALAQGRLCFPALQQRPVFQLQPGKTYRLRLVNTAGWTAFNFTVDGHTLRTIEVDGVDTVMSDAVEAVHIAAGQRYSFLLTIPSSGRMGSRFLIRASIRTEFLFTRPHNINPYPNALIREVTGVVVYSQKSSNFHSIEQFNSTDSENITLSSDNSVDNWSRLKFLDEMTLKPYDQLPAPTNFDKSVVLNITFASDAKEIRRGSFNKRPAELPEMPQLAMMINNVTMPETLFPVYIKFGDVVQVVVNNPEEGPHPIHLHGHHFWVMGMGHQGDGDYDPLKHQLDYTGVRRDTVLVKERSWLVIRFKADNVGVWTLHCHVDWHMLTGMLMTFVEAPELAHTLTIPDEARQVCADHNIVI